MGKQVAENTEIQETVRLIEVSGSYFIKRSKKPNRGLIKREYITSGNLLIYPKEWGNIKGSLKLIDDILEDEHKIIEQKQKKVEQLVQMKSQIEKMR